MDENRSRGSPRLQFSKEELENDALKRPIQRRRKWLTNMKPPRRS